MADLADESMTDKQVVDAIIGAYYPKIIDAGDAARVRAQAAQSVASLLVGAGTGGLALGAAREGAPVALWLACTAVVCWAGTTVLFLLAVGSPIRYADGLDNVDDNDALVQVVIKRARDDRSQVDRWIRRATLGTMISLVITLAALLTFLLLEPKTEPAAVTVTASQLAAIRGICPGAANPIRGHLEAGSIDDRFVVLSPDPGPCRELATQLHIPIETVVSVATT